MKRICGEVSGCQHLCELLNSDDGLRNGYGEEASKYYHQDKSDHQDYKGLIQAAVVGSQHICIICEHHYHPVGIRFCGI